MNLTTAQRRDLLRAYHSPAGEAYGLSYGPMAALTQTYHLATEIFHPRFRGFHIRINNAGRDLAADLEAKPMSRTRRLVGSSGTEASALSRPPTTDRNTSERSTQ